MPFGRKYLIKIITTKYSQSTLLVCSSLLLFLVLVLNTKTNSEIVVPTHKINPEQILDPIIDVDFEDKTLESGLTLVHQQGTAELKGLNETMGSGACVLDFNNDGWMDLFIVNGSGQTRFYGQSHWWSQPRSSALYKNTQNGKFEDVTKKAGLNQSAWGMGCVAADFDNDGDQDLLMINLGVNKLYRNNGDETFSDVTAQSGIKGDHWSTSASIADYDGDGLLDIYIVNFINYNKNAHTFEANKAYRAATSLLFDSSVYDSEPNKLYRNVGGLTFKEVSQEAGVADISGRGLSSVWVDINNDHWPDLYVANDQGLPDVLFLNQKNGTFQIAEKQFQLNSPQSSRSVAVGDIDRDGDIDLFISRGIGQAPSFLINGETSVKTVSTNRYKKNQFTDIAREMGLAVESTRSFSGWGAGLHDFNNDGWLDLFVINGLSTPNPDAPGITVGQEKLFWLNKLNGSFQRIENIRSLKAKQSARGVVFADFDNDGDIDIYATHNNDIGQLLINNNKNKNHWAIISFRTKQGNNDAIGTKVWLESEEGVLYKEIGSEQSYLSQSDRRVHFGFGKQGKNYAIKVRWPDGEIQFIKNLPYDRHVEINQGESNPRAVIYKAEKVSRNNIYSRNIRMPNSRQKYLEWITEVYPKKLMSELEKTLSDNESSVRLVAIDYIQQHKNSENLELLIEHVNKESNKKNLMVIIDAIRGYEDEHSIKILLSLFEKDDPTLQCKLAETFSFFFREEEAVVIRKYLALPYLIALLESTDAEARACAASALGEAEKYRGVKPLLQLLGDSEDLVKAAVVRSLGLIREKEAIPYLLQLILSNSQSVETSAHILIALKRLNFEKLEELLSDPFSSNNKKSIQRHLKILRSIQDNQVDGVVINQKYVSDNVIKWLSNVFSGKDISQNTILIDAISIINRNLSGKGLNVLKKAIKHHDATVRAHAYRVLISSIQSENISSSYAEQGLKDSDLGVRMLTLHALRDRSIVLPSIKIVPFLITKEEKLAAIPLLVQNQDKMGLKQLVSWIYDANESLQVRLRSLSYISSLPQRIGMPMIDISKLDNNDELIALAIRYQFNQLPKYPLLAKVPNVVTKGIQSGKNPIILAIVDSVVSRNEPWAKELQKQLLFDEKTPFEVNKRLIEHLGKSKQSYGNDLLFSFAKLRHRPLSLEAIKRLQPTDGRIEEFLWRIISNIHENESARFAAAEILYPDNKKKVIDSLHQFYSRLEDNLRTVH